MKNVSVLENESPMFCTTEDIYIKVLLQKEIQNYMYKKLKMYNALQYHNCNFIVFCSKHHIVTIILYLSAFILALSFHFPSFPMRFWSCLLFVCALSRAQGSGCAVAAVGFPDAAAQGANEAVHGVGFVCQLIP